MKDEAVSEPWRTVLSGPVDRDVYDDLRRLAGRYLRPGDSMFFNFENGATVYFAYEKGA